MRHHVISWIQRTVKANYRDGYTITDLCSTVKMANRNRLIEAGIGENELWDIVLGFVKCTFQIDSDNIR